MIFRRVLVSIAVVAGLALGPGTPAFASTMTLSPTSVPQGGTVTITFSCTDGGIPGRISGGGAFADIPNSNQDTTVTATVTGGPGRYDIVASCASLSDPNNKAMAYLTVTAPVPPPTPTPTPPVPAVSPKPTGPVPAGGGGSDPDNAVPLIAGTALLAGAAGLGVVLTLRRRRV